MSDPVEEYYRRFGGQAQTSVTVPVPGAASKAKKNQKELESIDSLINDRIVSNSIAQQNANTSAAAEARQQTKDDIQNNKDAKAQRDAQIIGELDNAQILRSISKAREYIQKHPQAVNVGSLLSWMPGTAARSLKGEIDNHIGGQVWIDTIGKMRAKSAEYGGTGTGAGQFTDKEGERAINSRANLDLGRTRPEVLASLDELEYYYKSFKIASEGYDPRDPNVARKFGLDKFKQYQEDYGKSDILSGGKNKRVEPPREMQVEFIDTMNNIPRGSLTVDQYRDIVGKLYGKYGFTFNPSQLEEDWVKEFNRPGGRPNFRIPGTDATPTFMEKNISSAVRTPMGAFAAKAINAGGLGIGELIAGQAGRDAMTAIGDIQPDASTIGDIVGSVAGTGLVGAGLKRVPTFAERAIMRDFTADVGSSALREFNQSNEGEGVWGAIGGGLEAGAMNLATRGVMRGLRKSGTPEQALVDANRDIKLTPLQQAALGDLEASVGNSPITSGARKRASEAAVNKFIKGAYDDINVVMPQNKVGRALIADLHKSIDDEFASIGSTKLSKIGNEGVNQIDALFREYIPINAFERRMMGQIRTRLNPLMIDGKLNATKEFTGQELRDVTEQFNKTWKKLVKDKAPERDVETERMAEFITKLKSILVDRISDPSLKDRFSKLSNAYARQVRLDDAARGLTLGFPTPEDLLGAVERNSMSRKAFAEGNAPFQKEVEDYIKILGPSTHKLDPTTMHLGGKTGLTASALAALTHLPGVSQAIGMPRKLGPINAEAIPIPMLSQALQSYILRKKQEEGLQ